MGGIFFTNKSIHHIKTKNKAREESYPLKDSNIGSSLKMENWKLNFRANYYMDLTRKNFLKLAIGLATWTTVKLDTFVSVWPRMNSLSRRNPGNKTEKQILGTNIDYALIVQGLDRDFNLMRLERYLTQVTACSVTPLVILNKADLVKNPAEYREEVLRLKRDCKIFFCSTLTGFGIQELKDAFEKGRTYILIGSSGVGKSSLLNILMNDDLQKTQSISTFNNKGTHTTTSRDLFQLPSGSLLIDTPGMREFGVTSEDGENSDSLFPAIEEFARQCRYSDCKHLHEEGCAVLEAMESGKLDRAIYDSYVKLMKEQRRFEINIEDQKRLNKQFGKMTKEAKNHRKKFKY